MRRHVFARFASAIRAIVTQLLLPHSPHDSPAAVNRQAWAWLREFEADLQADFEERVDL